MLNKKKILGILPMRSGSKGIKNKNLRLIKGKTLAWWTSKALMCSKLIDFKICCSDSKKLQNIAKKNGMLIPWTRPKHLAKDKTEIVKVLIHAIKKLKSKNLSFDSIVIVQATSPFVKHNYIDDAIRLFYKTNSNVLISATKLNNLNPEILFEKRNNRVSWLVKGGKNYIQRQKYSRNYYKRVGLIYILKVKKFMKTKNFVDKKTCIFQVPFKKSINIDNPKDLLEARKNFK